ncbi:hypothetical protein [Sphingomonas sp. M1A8_2b]
MRNNPFGLPETAVDRFLREERERANMYKDVFAGGAVAEAMRAATVPDRLFRGVDFDKPNRGILDTLERDRKGRERYKELTSTAWALSVTETARSIAQRSTGLVEQQRLLSSSVVDTMRAFDANRSTVATALAAARAGNSYRRMIEDMFPKMTGFGAIAERMRLVDVMTLHAGEGVVASATALAAEMVLETQRITAAIAAAPTEDEGAALFSELFEKVTAYVATLGPKTIAELNTMGLMQWTAWLFGFLGFVLAIVALIPNPSAEQQSAITELTQKYEVLRQEADQLSEADAKASEEFLDALPRAEIVRDAPLRRKPERAGEVVLHMQAGDAVVIEKAQGRWRLVVFRDPLSNQLSRAWVYHTALNPLADALDVSGD